jgi:hypothetical protein
MLDWRSANAGRARNSHHRNVDGRAQHLNGVTPIERSAPHPDRCRDVQGSSSKWAMRPTIEGLSAWWCEPRRSADLSLPETVFVAVSRAVMLYEAYSMC